MKSKLKFVYILGIFFLLIDQLIKFFISSKMFLNQNFVLIKNLLSLNLVHNEGAAFSILTGSRLLLIVVGILAVVLISFYIVKSDEINDRDILSYSLLLGGIVGNLIDRIVHGYVIDYISFNFFGYYFPVFNFADICIVLSIIIIVINIIKESLWK